MQPSRLRIELLSFDADIDNKLIDIFVINIDTPVGASSIQQIQSGMFKIAEINVTLEVVCMPDFTGEFCETTLVPTGNSIIVPAIVAASILALVTVVTVVIFSVVCIRLRRMSKHKNCRAIRSSNATREHDCTTSTPDYDYPHVVANGSRVQSEATYEATYEEIRPAFPTPNPSPNHNRNPTTSNDDHTPSNGDHTPSNEEIGARSQDEAHYNIKICPAYSSNNRNPHCTTNPAYAMAELGINNPRNSEVDDADHY